LANKQIKAMNAIKLEQLPGIPFALLFRPGETPSQVKPEHDAALAEIAEHLNFHAPEAGTSALFRTQLAWNFRRRYCAYSGKPYLFHVHSILDEIAHLERGRPTRTKKQEELSGSLSGFWHKHFFDPQFLARNLMEEVERNFDRFWHRDLVPRFEAETGRPVYGSQVDDLFAKLVAHSMVIDPFEERSGLRSRQAKPRMTGEWIVFTYDGSRRVYLTLALHAETNEAIIERLKATSDEFPFVLRLLEEAASNQET
jgi:hypothetical protein